MPTTTGRDCASCVCVYCLLVLVNSRFCLCTSLIPWPMIMVFGLGTRVCVHLYVQNYKMALYTTDSSQNDQSECEAIRLWVIVELCAMKMCGHLLSAMAYYTVSWLPLLKKEGCSVVPAQHSVLLRYKHAHAEKIAGKVFCWFLCGHNCLFMLK